MCTFYNHFFVVLMFFFKNQFKMFKFCFSRTTLNKIKKIGFYFLLYYEVACKFTKRIYVQKISNGYTSIYKIFLVFNHFSWFYKHARNIFYSPKYRFYPIYDNSIYCFLYFKLNNEIIFMRKVILETLSNK